MANKLKVEELRAKLAERGLSTTGLKSVLVERLEEAIAEDAKKDESKRKRKRNLDSSDGADESNKLIAIGELRAMNVKELREEASKRGLVETGTKKDLLERLCNDANNDSIAPVKSDGAEDDDDGFEEEKKEEKIVTATKKGAAVLDQWIPDNIKSQYHVLQRGDDVYDAMLNQTNVRDNNNKFFVLQVLESDNKKTYMVYFRWGRVGVKGQSKLDGPFHSWDRAIDIFSNKFLDKTKNFWSDRKEFIPHTKSYTWLEMDYGKEDNDSAVANDVPKSSSEVKPEESKLDPQVAKFISLICNVSMMAQHMMEIGYNANKLPLGKLSKSTITKGYEVLKRISEVMSRFDRARLEELSGEFYTVIPHDFGFKKMSQFVIDTPQKLKQKIEMVEALGEIELATKLLSIDPGLMDDPLYYHYQQLNCGLTPVGADSEEFSMVANYMENTHAKTHSGYTVEISQLFRASRAGEADRFQQFSSSKNRMLLWHGSRLTNWAGILSQGLRIAPPEAPVTGYMFGKGVYFADMFSKSANYCYANSGANDGVLLLCEVALGDMNELLNSDYNADKLPPGKLSTKGVGRTAPNPSEAKTLEDGVVVPLGKPVDHSSSKGTLLYNEYIVYNTEQIKMRYVIQVKFNYKY
ncbi:PREDICTED: poly [ADP-ribose] polymerase 2 isoform X5 [Brassica oleracea var. oleracea]|uniref:poly [ADP-ribose] polymerase 2 isoform X5 n=1 Tax=Brassica oleracea var. oleracea TaxID=109376 RepID=UPI0006A6E11B|nr:PREDICTED: poly [ADP-ribose] polymerase 2 isoform X5 [Brassica oleracea var. oleracea]